MLSMGAAVLMMLASAQDAPLFIENVSEWKALELKNSKGQTQATLTIRTAWSEIGYSHAKEYQLDL